MAEDSYKVRKKLTFVFMKTFFLSKSIVLLLIMLSYSQESIQKIWSNQEFNIFGKIDADYNDEIIYYDIEIRQYDSTIYHDSLDMIVNKKEPVKARLFQNEGRKLLIYVADDRPLKDKLRMLFFNNDSLIKVEKVPNFFNQIKTIEKKPKIYSDYLDFTEAYCMKCDTSYYNPILAYQISFSGAVIDSALTIKMNKEKLGDFYGFSPSYDILIVKKSLKEIK